MVIVVARMNVVPQTYVAHTAVQNVVQIQTVVHLNIVASTGTTTITMSADEAVPGKHATRVLTAEARRNIVLRLKNVVIIPISVRTTVTAQAVVNVVDHTNVLLLVVRLPCHAHQILIAPRRSIVVNVAASQINVAQLVLGKNASRMKTAVVPRSSVT